MTTQTQTQNRTQTQTTNSATNPATNLATVSRRTFVGGTLGTIAAAAAAIPVINVAQAAESSAAADSPANEGAAAALTPTAPTRTTGFSNNELLEEQLPTLIKMLEDSPVATEDLTLPDGTVIDKTYVTLWNRLNRLNNGLSNTPGVHSFDLIQSMWSLEDAEKWNHLPLFKWFTAYDYALEIDTTEDEAHEILNNFASNRIIAKATRASVDWYYVLSWAGALIPMNYSRIDKDFITMNDRLMGVDSDVAAQYPIYDVYPVSADVVEGGKLAPYRDWRAVFERNTVFVAQPCGCRNKAILRGDEDEHEEGIVHCMVFGELAQYLVDLGTPALTREEALAEAEKLVGLGYVPEGAYAEYPDIMCFCRSDNCALLTAHRNTKGEARNFPNASAYVLDYDRDKCIQCYACVDRCPLYAVEIDDEGYCVMDKWCVGCGQCALVCPADARILKLKDQIPPKPLDLLGQITWSSADRMMTNRIVDFEGTELPQYAIDASEAADEARQAAYNWLVDQKPTGGADSYEDGTYEATQNGIQGPIPVTVEIEGGKISSVTIGENQETVGYGTAAIALLPDEIVEANGLDVDVVAGATHTSIAILRAVQDCLKQAGFEG